MQRLGRPFLAVAMSLLSACCVGCRSHPVPPVPLVPPTTPVPPVPPTTPALPALPGARPTAAGPADAAHRLCLAIARDRTEEALAMIAAGADVNAGDAVHGSPPLYYAAFKGRAMLPVIVSLLERGADVNRPGIGGSTPLHAACAFDNREVAALLIKHGANISAKDRYGITPLHTAAFAAYSTGEMIAFLLANGADATATDRSGKTPLDHAIETGDADRVDVLTNARRGPSPPPPR